MKKLLLIIFVLAMAVMAFAQTDITIGTGTATGRFPFNDYFVYSRSQCIYLESEIGAPGTIHKLRWYRSDTGADASAIGTTQIWLKSVSNAVITDANWEDPGTLVYEVSNIDLGSGGGWYEVDITDFVYTGGNLLVSFYTQNAPYTAPHSYWYYTTTTGYNRCRTGNSDTVNPPTTSLSTARPNIQINMTTSDPTTAPNPAVLISPAIGGYALIGDALSWSGGGGFPLGYDVYLDTTDASTLVSNHQTGTTYTPTLAAGTTYYWKVVPYNGFGNATGVTTWSFKTPSATQLVESFESTTFPPTGWARTTSSTSYWGRSTTQYKAGTASMYAYTSTSTVYTISTPKLTFAAGSKLNFWTYAGATSQKLQILYSSDRTSWTQFGADITYAAASTWYNIDLDMSSLAGNNYYLAFSSPVQTTGYQYIYVDMVIGPEITPEAPGPVTLSTPADLATAVSEYPTFTWTAPTTGGVPTGYAVYCSTSNPPNYTTDLIGSTTGALTFTATTALNYETVYYWTVKAYNVAGDSSIPTPRSFTTRANPTISSFPYTVDFSTWMPTNWSQYNYLYGGTPVAGGTSWGQDDWLNTTTPVNKAARINVYNLHNNWMVTPPIQIPAAGYELKFDLALMVWSTVSTAVTAGNQADDRFLVVISNNPDMSSPTTLMEWNNTGSGNVFDLIPPAGNTYTIDLDSYVGTKYIGFYAESVTDTSGDNDLMFDNVIVRETPAVPIFSYNPANIDFGTTFANTPTAYQDVTISNVGPGTINIGLADVSIVGTNAGMFSFDSANLPAALGSAIIPVRYNPTAAGNHSATLRIVYNSTNYDVALTGIAYAENAFFESFEGATFPPADWTTSPTAWTTFTTYAHSGTKSTKSGYSSGTWWLMTPALDVTDGDNTLSFWYRDNSDDEAWDYDDEYTYVMISTTGNATADFTTTLWTGDYQTFTTAWQQASIDLSAYNGQTVYIAFKSDHTGGNYRIVDDVFGPARYIPAGPPEPVTIDSPVSASTDMPIGGFNISWTPASTGGTATYYAVYMSQDEETIYDDVYFETTATSLNPTTYTEGPSDPITFNYLERWYFTVQALNNDGDAVVEPALWFEIEDAPQVITTFPWTENFDAALTAPEDWVVADLDGGGTYWMGSTTYSHSAPNAFVHSYSTEVEDPGQDGWLITPAIQVPAGNYYLSWWNYNVYPTWMIYNGVKVNTTNDPNAAGWTEIWSQETAGSAWSQAVVSISAYAGQTVYFAFNYQGYDGDNWFIDDVSVYELTVDTFGPVITHLPVLNTPREDYPALVSAQIVDDATWNNPVGGANVYYSTDDGSTWSAPISMTAATAPNYYAYIPAQPLGTTVTYKIEAWDSLNNMSTTSNYAFGVNDPTWIWYDAGGTTYLGYTSYIFGPTVLFQNPFYGTGNAMQLMATDGSSAYGNTANLHVYSYDGTTMTDVITPFAVTFGVETYEVFDLSSYNIQITTPYFLVAYEDIPAGNYILFDSTYDYGTTYVRIEGSLYTLSNSGSWCIGANVQTGESTVIDAPVITLSSGLNGMYLDWEAITGANSYGVYGSETADAADPWNLLGTVTTPGYAYTGTEASMFFKVVADSDAPVVRTGVLTNLPSRSFGKAVKAPKTQINIQRD